MNHVSFDGDKIDWIDDDPVRTTCKYQMAILGADPGEPDRPDREVASNSYCHFHRHVADTAILVLEGDQIVTEILEDGSEGETKVRPAGTYVMSKGGEAHMEKGGPNGATVFFALHSVEGTVFETLDKDMNVLDASTVAATASNLGFANPGAAA